MSLHSPLECIGSPTRSRRSARANLRTRTCGLVVEALEDPAVAPRRLDFDRRPLGRRRQLRYLERRRSRDDLAAARQQRHRQLQHRQRNGNGWQRFQCRLWHAHVQQNETTESILVPIRGDRVVEPTESFSVRLTNAKSAQIARGQGFVTIVDNEPHVSISDATLIEGDSGTATMAFNVTLQAAYDAASPSTTPPSTAPRPVAATTPRPRAPYYFQPGQTQQTIAIAVKGDRVAEPDETLSVQLTMSNNSVTLDRSVAQGTILDNEPHVSIDDPGLWKGMPARRR